MGGGGGGWGSLRELKENVRKKNRAGTLGIGENAALRLFQNGTAHSV